MWTALLVTTMAFACGQGNDRDDTGPIAVSGGVEVYEINIERRKVSYGAKGADIINMTLALWFQAKWKGQRDHFLVRLTGLDPIVDDTGKDLSTKVRRKDIDFLWGEVLANDGFFRGIGGPVISIGLDVPARRATTLKHIKGKAVVSSVRYQTIKFPLAAVLGKPLKHPLLKDLKIRPRMVIENGDTSVTLRVPKMHGRLFEWNLEAAGRSLDWWATGNHLASSGVDLDQQYSGKLPEGCLLVLVIAVPTETKTFDFDFKNVELP